MGRERPNEALGGDHRSREYPNFEVPRKLIGAFGHERPYANREKTARGLETCSACGGGVKVIACIEDPVVIETILTHLNEKAAAAGTGLLPEVRALPQAGLFD